MSKVTVKCTYANPKLQPDVSSLTIKSYYPTGTLMGTTTGKTSTDTSGKEWVEVSLLNCNREKTGWVRTDTVILTEENKNTVLPWLIGVVASILIGS